MEQTNYRSFKLSKVCDEIESVITTLKQIQSQMDLKNYTKLHETIQKLEDHKQYIWQIYKDLEVLEWLKNYPGGVKWPVSIMKKKTFNKLIQKPLRFHHQDIHEELDAIKEDLEVIKTLLLQLNTPQDKG